MLMMEKKKKISISTIILSLIKHLNLLGDMTGIHKIIRKILKLIEQIVLLRTNKLPHQTSSSRIRKIFSLKVLPKSTQIIITTIISVLETAQIISPKDYLNIKNLTKINNFKIFHKIHKKDISLNFDFFSS